MNDKNVRINVVKPFLPPYEEYIAEIKNIWNTNLLTNFGPEHEKFKKLIKEYLKTENIFLFSNGHMALEVALDTIEEKGEVITTPFTFVSTTHAISRCGFTPVFCDVNEDDYLIDVDKIEGLINENTRAIMPVHVYGNICNVEKIDELAKKYNLKVIYDGAHAFGVKYKGTPISNFGDFTMFSFHATKVFHSVEGGGLVVNNKNYTDMVHKLKSFGLEAEDSKMVGTNAKMTEFHAAMGVCNMKYIEKIVETRRKYYEAYLTLLGGLKGIKLNYVNQDIEANYSYFPIFVEESTTGFNRDILLEVLQEDNIFTRKYFYPLTNEMTAYSEYKSDETPIAKKISEGILCLPLYYDMNMSDIERICKVIVDFHKIKDISYCRRTK